MNDKKTNSDWLLTISVVALLAAWLIGGIIAERKKKMAGESAAPAPHVDTSLPPPPKFFPNSDVKIPAELDARIHTLRVNEWKGNLYQETVKLVGRGLTLQRALETVAQAQIEVKKSHAYEALTDYDKETMNEAIESYVDEMLEIAYPTNEKPAL